MDKIEFLEVAAKQEKIEQFASAYSTAYLQRDDEKAKEALLKALIDGSASRAVQCFESAFRSGMPVEDREAVFEAVKVSGWSLEYAGDSIRSDIEVVMQALKQSGYALQFASEQLRDDKLIVIEAIKNAPLSFRYASEALKSDHEIALAAIRAKPYNLKDCSDDLRGNKAFVMEAIVNERMLDSPSLYSALKQLWTDPELLAATEKKEKEKADRRESSGFNAAYG
jgi:hypothetical protein